jgi:hypothetical protein
MLNNSRVFFPFVLGAKKSVMINSTGTAWKTIWKITQMQY